MCTWVILLNHAYLDIMSQTNDSAQCTVLPKKVKYAPAMVQAENTLELNSDLNLAVHAAVMLSDLDL